MTEFISWFEKGDPTLRWMRVFALSLTFIGLLTLGRLPLLDEDEGEYSEVAAEMAASGHYLAPTLNQTPFYEKPILLFWVQQPFVQLLGSTEWAFRVPSMVAMVILLCLIFRRVEGRWGEAEAWTSCTLMALSLGFVVVSRAATMDALVLLFLTLTLFSCWDFFESGERQALRSAYLWAGLGFLTKGPMAVLIPGVVALLFVLIPPRPNQRLIQLLDPWGLLVFGVVALPWFAWYGVYSDGAFTDYFFLRENVGRLGGSLQGHSGSVFYYFLILPLVVLPFSWVLVGLIRSIRDAWQDDFTRFLALWFLVVLVLFSLAGTKLPHYIVYGLPPVFMLGQRVYLDRNRRMMLLASPLLILPLCGLALPALVNRVSISTANPYLAEMFWQGRAYFDLVFGLKAFGWFALSLFIFLGSLRVETRSARLRLLAAMGLVSAVGVSVVLLPAVTYFQQDPVREAAMVARGLHQPVISDNRMPSFSVYLGAPTEVRAPRAGDIAFGRLDHLDRLGHQYETLYARQGIRLVRVTVP